MALNRVDPQAAQKAGAVSVVIKILNDSDDQVAYRAADYLRDFRSQLDLALPALIEALQSHSTLVACQAVWTLEAAFNDQAVRFIPALQKAAERQDSVANHAASALKKLEAQTIAH